MRPAGADAGLSNAGYARVQLAQARAKVAFAVGSQQAFRHVRAPLAQECVAVRTLGRAGARPFNMGFSSLPI